MSKKMKWLLLVVAAAIVLGAGILAGSLMRSREESPATATDGDSAVIGPDFSLEGMVIGEGELEFAREELLYYCNSIYNNLFMASYQYDYYYGPGSGVLYSGFDCSVSPEKQAYNGELEGYENPTYMDYIIETGVDQLHTVKAIVRFAEENGISLSDEKKAEAKEMLASNKAQLEGTDMTLDEYLGQMYGENMTEELLENIFTEQFLLDEVDKAVTGKFEEKYTDSEIEKIFNEKFTDYAVVDMRYYTFEASADSSVAPDEEQMKAAREKAEQFRDALTDEESFLRLSSEQAALAGDEAAELYLTEDSYTLAKAANYAMIYGMCGEENAKWALSTDRVKGDCFIAEIKDVGYQVYMITEPAHKMETTYLYDVRHILLSSSEAQQDTQTKISLLDTKDYDVTVDITVDINNTKAPAVFMQAQDILKEYLEGDRTEDSFSDLAKLNSCDGNAAQGGIYEGVAEGDMVIEFESWALKQGRQPGDVGIVESDYGYHIMYFIGKQVDSSWDKTVLNDQLYKDISAFMDELRQSYHISTEEHILQTRQGIELMVKENISVYSELLSAE